MERHTLYWFKSLVTDGGGDFTSNTCINRCKSKGIEKHKKMPHEHNKHSLAEIVMCTINKMSRKCRLELNYQKTSEYFPV